MSDVGPRVLPGIAGIELHSRDCQCGGSGWLSAPNIGPHASGCPARGRTIILLPTREWVRLGRPKTIEEYREKGGEA